MDVVSKDVVLDAENERVLDTVTAVEAHAALAACDKGPKPGLNAESALADKCGLDAESVLAAEGGLGAESALAAEGGLETGVEVTAKTVAKLDAGVTQADNIEELKECAGDPTGSTENVEDTVEEADGNTCAVCLEQIPAADISMVKGCEHVYCVYCILKWASCKDTPWCPQCKSPFSYVYCYRHLDGTLSDFPVEESVTLLKRAKWFQERVKTEEKGKTLCEEDALTAVPTQDWYQEFYEDFDDGHEDEEIEEFYFSRAAGHARIVIANRRWGEGGYMRAGRMFATPTSGGSSHGKAKSKGVGKSGKAHLDHVYGSSPPPGASFMGTSPGAMPGTSPSASGSGSGKPGRRAKRNAKRVAADETV